MIQRIQTIYLVIAAFLMVLMFSNPLAQIIISNKLYLTLWNHHIISVNDDLFTPMSTWPITVLISIIVCIEVLTIFLYKRRLIQIRLCIFNIILMFGLVGLIYYITKYSISSSDGLKSVFLWPIVCPMIAIILNYLALKAIQKDENLVRSYDRIR